MADILVIDDEKDILFIIKEALMIEGNNVLVKTSVKDIDINSLNKFDLIILDVMMPDVDGFSYCKEIRKIVDVPILFLTAKAETSNIIEGLAIGGDDYITKPFNIDELNARVMAHLRREKREKRIGIKFEQIYINLNSKEIYVLDEKVAFTKAEYEICVFLANSARKVFSKEQIYVNVFGYDGNSNSSVISEHIKNIRAKFKERGVSPIDTVWGIGYKWV